MRSGDDVGEQLILAPGDLVAQLKLAFLEPRELELVGNRRAGERDDRGVEVAVLDAQKFEALADLFGAHAATLPRSPLVRNGDRLAES